MLETILTGTKIAAGIAGLFGGKKASVSNNVEELARGAEDAAKKFGFNPLTMLQAGSGAAGLNTSSGMPPLASIELITGGLTDLMDAKSGDKERQQKAQDLDNDIRQIQLDKLRSGVIAVAPDLTHNVGNGPSPLGKRPVELTLPTEQVSQPVGFALRPKMKPNLFTNGEIPVIGPDGGQMSMPRAWADRLKLNPWDAVIMEDYEAILGDEIGQAAGLPKTAKAAIALEGGLFKPATTNEKRRKIYPDLYPADKPKGPNGTTYQRYLNRKKK